jgi:hypothetical protein
MISWAAFFGCLDIEFEIFGTNALYKKVDDAYFIILSYDLIQ